METPGCQTLFTTSHSHRSSWGTLGRLATLLLAISFHGAVCEGWAEQKDVESSSKQVMEIPFTLYNNNLIIVKGTVGPIRGLNLILDTGTTPTSISKSLAKRLKLRGNIEPLQTLNGVIQTESFILPHIEVGAMSADDLRVITQDLGFIEAGLGIPIGGILGLDVLRTHNFAIDYRKKKIFFGVTTAIKNSVHFETQALLMMVKANVEGHDLRLIVDSGTSGLVVFRNRINQTVSALRSSQGTFVATVAGAPQAKFLRTLVTLGGETSEHVIVIADADLGPENDFDGLLGFADMGFQTVCFDFYNGVLGWE